MTNGCRTQRANSAATSMSKTPSILTRPIPENLSCGCALESSAERLCTGGGSRGDWPISYGEIAPYYDRAEEFIGVSGKLDQIPHLPDGKFMPPMPLTCGEQLIRKGAGKTGRR